MKRIALEYLKEWSLRKSRKPLIIRGARQVGKSYLVRLFAKEESLDLIELNFEENPGYKDLFKSNNPVEILQLLEVVLNRTVDPEKSLLFLDEIQAAPEVLPVLRYFYEKLPSLRVAAAGSLLEFLLKEHSFAMPVGRIEYLFLGPMSFEEFLLAGKKEKLYEYLKLYTPDRAIPVVIHDEFTGLLKKYLVLGGMPEVVKTFYETGSYKECDIIKQSIVMTYRDDFNKYKPGINTQTLQKVFQKIPHMIGRKIVYSQIDRETRSKEISAALELLQNARIIYRVFHSGGNGVPLGAEVNEKYAKGLFLDAGLMCRLLGLTLLDLNNIEDLILINSGALCEQFVGTHLLYSGDFYMEPELYYWVREKSRSAAEIDYLISLGSKIIPVEVKAGKTGRLKSLQVFLQQKGYNLALRFNMDLPSVLETETTIPGRKQPFRFISLPLYMAGEARRILSGYL